MSFELTTLLVNTAMSPRLVSFSCCGTRLAHNLMYSVDWVGFAVSACLVFLASHCLAVSRKSNGRDGRDETDGTDGTGRTGRTIQALSALTCNLDLKTFWSKNCFLAYNPLSNSQTDATTSFYSGSVMQNIYNKCSRNADNDH